MKKYIFLTGAGIAAAALATAGCIVYKKTLDKKKQTEQLEELKHSK